MKTAVLIGVIVLTVAVAIGVCTWSRVPWMRARIKRRGEYRILHGPGLYLDPPLLTSGLPRDGRPLDARETAAFTAITAAYADERSKGSA